jgi:hypothetical protein
MDNPCYDKITKTSCSRRCAGCSIDCPDWKLYESERNEKYYQKKTEYSHVANSYEIQRTQRIKKKMKRHDWNRY